MKTANTIIRALIWLIQDDLFSAILFRFSSKNTKFHDKKSQCTNDKFVASNSL